jgi:hypothetical protein
MMRQSERNLTETDRLIRHEASADLTWAELYTKKIHTELKALCSTIKKSAATPETAETAALLRRQLEVAHRTLDELKKRTLG